MNYPIPLRNHTRMTDEGKELSELAARYRVKKSLVDIGARLQGSNVWHLVDKFGSVLIDKNPKHCSELRKWLPKADVRNVTITPSNINDHVGDVGILCIDVDGNDYHLWKALKAQPQIVVIETAVQRKQGDPDYIEPYDPGNAKRDGSGMEALKRLAAEKGYRFSKRIAVNLIFLHESLFQEGLDNASQTR